MTEEEKPWWYWKCTHREHEVSVVDGELWGCFMVSREAEGTVVLYQRCRDRIHFLVERSGVGSVCQEMTPEQYEAMDERQLLEYVQSKYRELSSL